MRKFFTLAAASVFLLGLSNTADGAMVEVLYQLTPGTGTATYTPTPGGVGSGNAGGTMTIWYTSGSPTVGGTLGTVGVMKVLAVTLVTPATVLGGGFTIPAIGAGNRAVGNRTAGGIGNFGGATHAPQAYFTPNQPAINGNGNVNFAPTGAPLSIKITGAGTQVIGFNFAWTVTGITGQEVSRTVVPDVDVDGLPDTADNCQAIANGPLAATYPLCYAASVQINADGDAFGEPCDGDFPSTGNTSGDSVINATDTAYYVKALTGTGPTAGADMNCDTVINATDTSLYVKQLQQGVPGP